MQTRSVLALLFGLLLGTASSFGQFSFASIDVPNSMATWASGIGPAGQIVGGYMDASGREHGYLYEDGTFTTIDVPGSLVGLPALTTLETEVNGINPRGDMVGDYFAPPGAPDAPGCTVAFAPACRKGFLYSRGEFSSVLVPPHVGSVPSAITPDGTIYGCLHDQTFGNEMIGFIRIPHGNGKSFDYETLQAGDGEVTDPSQSSQSRLNSMNNAATPDGSIIVGLYTPPGAARPHGYTVVNGHFADYMFPGSVATQIWGINPDGDFVGIYRDSTGVHGFLQPGDGSASVPVNYVDPDTGATASLTEALGINPAGAIVGTFLDSMGQHGFVTVHTSD
jgi:probable HAF family extracellular repeat protein